MTYCLIFQEIKVIMKFGQVIQINMINFCLEKLYTKYRETIPRSFPKNQNLPYLWINSLKLYSLFFLYVKLRAIKIHYTLFFISNNIISNARLKLAKNQANAKQHPEAELLAFQNNSHSSYTLSTKNDGTYSKK